MFSSIIQTLLLVMVVSFAMMGMVNYFTEGSQYHKCESEYKVNECVKIVSFIPIATARDIELAKEDYYSPQP